MAHGRSQIHDYSLTVPQLLETWKILGLSHPLLSLLPLLSEQGFGLLETKKKRRINYGSNSSIYFRDSSCSCWCYLLQSPR